MLFGRQCISGMDEGLVINLFLYLTTTIVAFIGTYVYKYLIVDRDRHYIEQAFSRYIAPEVVDEIAKNPKSLRL